MKYDSEEYYNLIQNLGVTKKEIYKNWKKAFECISEHLGFDKKSTKILFEWGNGGYNWEQLHFDKTKYKSYSFSQLINLLDSEATYCSDRMSLDRLFRCHWIFNEIKRKL